MANFHSLSPSLSRAYDSLHSLPALTYANLILSLPFCPSAPTTIYFGEIRRNKEYIEYIFTHINLQIKLFIHPKNLALWKVTNNYHTSIHK